MLVGIADRPAVEARRSGTRMTVKIDRSGNERNEGRVTWQERDGGQGRDHVWETHSEA